MIRKSKHSRQRLTERVDLPREHLDGFVRAARYNGVPLERVEDEALREELKQRFRVRHSILRYYKGYVFIFSHTNVLKTVVKV